MVRRSFGTLSGTRAQSWLAVRRFASVQRILQRWTATLQMGLQGILATTQAQDPQVQGWPREPFASVGRSSLAEVAKR